MKKFILFFIIIFIPIACSNSNENNIVEQPERKVVAKINDERLKEVSGISESQLVDNIIWLHNDSQDNPRIFAINLNGEVIAEVTLKNATNVDWEEIKVVKNPNDSQSYIYIGDIGDNLEVRNDYKFYVLQEPIIDTNKRNQQIEVSEYQMINFEYPDKKHDCEAFFVENNVIHIFTKRDSMAHYFTLKNPIANNKNIAEFQTKTKIGQFRTRYPTSRIVGADLSNNEQHLLVKSYDSVYYFKASSDWKSTLSAEPQFVYYVPEVQGEAICWNKKDTGFWTLSEAGPVDVQPVLYYYNFVGPIKK